MKQLLLVAARISISSLLFLAVTPASADTINIPASVWGTARDTGLDGSFETLSFPNNIVLQSLPGINLVDRGIWEFNLSQLPTGNITSIVMELIVVSTTLDRTNFDVYGYSGDGSIQPMDASGGQLIAASLNGNVVSQSSPIFIDVTSFIMEPSIEAAGYAGFYARYANESSGATLQKQLQDPNASFGNASPWLVVTYSTVPIPTAAWLFGSGLLSLLGVANRKKMHS